MGRVPFQYFVPDLPQKRLGAYITVAGYETYDKRNAFPSSLHSPYYLSVHEKGRVLKDTEHQILYIRSGTGIAELLTAIEENLPKKLKRVKLLLPFDKAGIAAKLRQTAVLHSEAYTAEGIEIEVTLDEIQYARLREYVTER